MYLGEGSNAGEASTSEAGHVDALRQKRHGPSRYFSERAGTFAEALAAESTGAADPKRSLADCLTCVVGMP